MTYCVFSPWTGDGANTVPKLTTNSLAEAQKWVEDHNTKLLPENSHELINDFHPIAISKPVWKHIKRLNKYVYVRYWERIIEGKRVRHQDGAHQYIRYYDETKS